MALVKMWKQAPWSCPGQRRCLPQTIDASIQGVVRREVLDVLYDGTANHLRQRVVVVGRLMAPSQVASDGQVVLIDGSYRWAVTRLLGKPWLSVQTLGL
jgi:hypothetical protein